jgi:radical SAM protein with 4Fe4S-binding SPASM domain
MGKIPTVKNGIKTIEDFLNKPGSEKILRNLLAEKAPRRTEVEVSFFQICNLKCAFCWQDHNDPTGIESIREKSKTVLEYLKKSDHLKEEINITMTGGELFQDGMEDSVFDDLEYFITDIAKNSKTLTNSLVSFTIISSLFFEEETLIRVRKFLDRLQFLNINFALATSWDPVGRPAKNFLKNISALGAYVKGITTVMTAPNIKKIMSGESDFEYYNLQYGIEFDYYVPTATASYMMPSDIELRDFFVYLSKNHPETSIIKAWRESLVNPVSCGSLNKLTILPDGSLVTCRQLKYDANDFQNEIIQNSNANIIEKYIAKNECLSCPYFSRCTLSCFVMNDHKSYQGKKTLNYCFYKDVFKSIDDNE